MNPDFPSDPARPRIVAIPAPPPPANAKRVVGLLLAAALVALGGYAHGRWINRWGPPPEIQAAVRALDRLPRRVGDWVAREREIPPDVLRAAEVDGAVTLSYRNLRTGAEVDVALVCGRPAAVGRHSPAHCYPGAGYEPTGEAATLVEPSTGAVFRALNFTKPRSVIPAGLSVLWSFGDQRGWRHVERPRFTHFARPNLYKLYVLRRGHAETWDAPPDPDPDGFLKVFLPALDEVLRRPPGESVDEKS